MICNKEKDSITNVWLLRVYKSPYLCNLKGRLIFYSLPHLCNVKRRPIFLSPLDISKFQITWASGNNHAWPLNIIKNAKPSTSIWLHHPVCTSLLLLFHSLINLNPSWGIFLVFYYVNKNYAYELVLFINIHKFLNEYGR